MPVTTASTFILLLLYSIAPADSAVGPARPNFLILFVDDLGYNEINLGDRAPSSGGRYLSLVRYSNL